MGRKIEVEIVGNVENLEKQVSKANAKISQLEKQLKKASKATDQNKTSTDSASESHGIFSRKLGDVTVGSAALTAGLIGLTAAGYGYLKEGVTSVVSSMMNMGEQEVITAAHIRSTGGAAGITAGQVSDLAKQMEGLTGTDRAQVQSAENLMLTFENVKNVAGANNDIFTQGVKSAMDLSTAYGRDLNESVIMVGKALQDPARGMTNLRRIGVMLTDEQVKQVKALQKSGDTLDAQKMILKELNVEMGGTAEAVGETAPKQWAKFTEKVKYAAVSVLEKAMPALSRLTGWLNDSVAPALQGAADHISKFIDDWSKVGLMGAIHLSFGDSLDGVINVVKPLFHFIEDHWEAVAAGVGAVMLAFGGPVTAIAGLVAILPILVENFGSIRGAFEKVKSAIEGLWNNPAVKAVLGSIWDNLKSAFGSLKDAVVKLGPAFSDLMPYLKVIGVIIGAVILAAIWTFSEELKVAAGIISNVVVPIIGVFAKVLGAIGTVVIAAAHLVIDHWGQIKSFISGAVHAVVSVITTVWNTITGIVGGVFGAVLGVVTGAWDSISGAVTTGIDNVVSFFSGLPGKITSTLGDLSQLLYDAGSKIIGGLLSGITDKFNDVKNFVGGIGSWISDHKGPLEVDRVLLVPAGHAIMEGLNTGIRDRLGAIGETMATVTGTISAAGSPTITAGISRPNIPTSSMSSATTMSPTINFHSGAIQVNGAAAPEATAEAVYQKIIERLGNNARNLNRSNLSGYSLRPA